jgi:23S rRNA pseudouridine955/2504/2580 synthase
MLEIKIDYKNANQRIDKLVRKTLTDAPLSFIYRLFRIKDIKVNNKRTTIDYIVQTGDVITIYISENQLNEFKKSKPLVKEMLTHQIVYEDNQVLIINKPSGLLVHGDINEKRRTLTNQVLNYLYFKEEYDYQQSNFTVAPAHRIDRNTSGLVVFGKTNSALQQLQYLFKEHQNISKKYLALVVGKTEPEATINKRLYKDDDKQKMFTTNSRLQEKEAITKYRTLKHYKNKYSLIEVTLITGRTHQIRAHMESINHPIVGDRKYGNFIINNDFKKKYGYEHQFLHAHQIEFKKISNSLVHLSNKTFEAELLSNESIVLKNLENDMNK